MVRRGSRRKGKKPSQGTDPQEVVSEETRVVLDSENKHASRSLDDTVGVSESVAVGASPPSPTTPVTSPNLQRQQEEGSSEVGNPIPGESTDPALGKKEAQEKDSLQGSKEELPDMAATNGSEAALNKVEELNEKNEALELERDSLRKLMGVKDEAVKQSEAERVVASEKCEIIEGEKVALQAEKENLSKQLESRANEITQYKATIAALESEMVDYKAQNSELAMRLSKLNEERGDFEKQTESLKQSSSTSESAIQDLTEKLRIVQSERDSVKVRLAECQADMWKLEEEGKQARAEVQALRDGPHAEMQSLEVEVQDLTNQLCSAEFLLEDSKVKNSKMEELIVRFQRSRRESMILAGVGGAAVSAAIVGGVCVLLSRRRS
ncbi:hypothetical protein BSKO_03603 [Bryopsis sp. KO-2023]|nr:hypothetical protein BSKO_03603 [Bryopsis sp. KO-2023]